MSDDEYQATGDSGASNTFPMQCSSLRKNGHVIIKDRPCKIVEMSTSKTGKHGHAKVHMVAIDIFTGKKLEEICPSTHNMNVPNVSRKEYQVVDVTEDGFFELMDDKGDIKQIKVPEGGVGTLKNLDQVKAHFKETDDNNSALSATVLSALTEETVKELKYARD